MGTLRAGAQHEPLAYGLETTVQHLKDIVEMREYGKFSKQRKAIS
jgi:hypothetical protein